MFRNNRFLFYRIQIRTVIVCTDADKMSWIRNTRLPVPYSFVK